MLIKLRPFVQLLFIGIFLTLMISQKAQIWMAIIFLSIILATFFGRFYCGWICPINTLIRPVNFIKRKLGIGKKEVPKVFKSEKIRWIGFGLFLIGLGYTIYTIKLGKKFPLPLIIIPLGLLTTLFINEKTWHRYLCPWGVLFSLTGRFSKFKLEPKKCTVCSLCKRNCPADAIYMDESSAVIDSTHCLLCFECQEKCPINAIKYTVKTDNIKNSAK